MHTRVVRLLAAFALAALAAAVGCSKRHCVPAEWSKTRTLVDLSTPPDAHAPLNPGLLREVAGEFRRRGETVYPPGTPPYRILALSGGGVYGAFGVGVINGWSAAGTRPEFDVVTGISTGAFMATFAFLGSAYDAPLAEAAIERADKRNLIRRVPIPLIPYLDALYTARPLEKQIREMITPQVLCEVAKAHAAGRRLYVGSTNLDTRKLIIWDMGAIASRGTPDALHLYRQVLMASGAIPGAFPPVRIRVEIDGRMYDEMHVDGGVSDEVIFRGFMVGDLNRLRGAGSWAPPGSTLYVVNNGKLYSNPACVPRSLFGIFGAARVHPVRQGAGRVLPHPRQLHGDGPGLPADGHPPGHAGRHERPAAQPGGAGAAVPGGVPQRPAGRHRPELAGPAAGDRRQRAGDAAVRHRVRLAAQAVGDGGHGDGEVKGSKPAAAWDKMEATEGEPP